MPWYKNTTQSTKVLHGVLIESGEVKFVSGLCRIPGIIPITGPKSKEPPAKKASSLHVEAPLPVKPRRGPKPKNKKIEEISKEETV